MLSSALISFTQLSESVNEFLVGLTPGYHYCHTPGCNLSQSADLV